MADNMLSELEALGKEIKKAEGDVQTEEGKISAYKQSLKEEFKVDNIEEADKLLTKIRKETDEIDKTIDEKFSKLQEEYNW